MELLNSPQPLVRTLRHYDRLWRERQQGGEASGSREPTGGLATATTTPRDRPLQEGPQARPEGGEDDVEVFDLGAEGCNSRGGALPK